MVKKFVKSFLSTNFFVKLKPIRNNNNILLVVAIDIRSNILLKKSLWTKFFTTEKEIAFILNLLHVVKRNQSHENFRVLTSRKNKVQSATAATVDATTAAVM